MIFSIYKLCLLNIVYVFKFKVLKKLVFIKYKEKFFVFILK